MDNDTQMLTTLGDAVVDLEVKFRGSSLAERVAMKPTLEQLLRDYAQYRLKLLTEGVVTTEKELEEMSAIADEVSKAADNQKLLIALAKTVAFVATKV